MYRNKEDATRYMRKYHLRCRMAILYFYGLQCHACGCKDLRVLQVDHIVCAGNKGGKRLSEDAPTLLRKIKEHPEEYQLLCANCNWIKRIEQEEVGGKDYYDSVLHKREAHLSHC